MSSYGSNLTLQQIVVEEMVYQINTGYDLSKISEAQVSINPRPRLNKEDPSLGVLELEVTLFDQKFQEKNEPLFLKITVLGFYKADDVLGTEDNIFDKYLSNTISMLYPYIRSYIASITGMFGIDAIRLPAINVLKMLEEKVSENKNSNL